MYIHAYIRVYTCIHTHPDLCWIIHVTCMYIHAYMHIHSCIYIYKHTWNKASSAGSSKWHPRTYIHTLHTYTRAYAHTHTLEKASSYILCWIIQVTSVYMREGSTCTKGQHVRYMREGSTCCYAKTNMSCYALMYYIHTYIHTYTYTTDDRSAVPKKTSFSLLHCY
jgi:hypothetical protein